VNSPCRIFGAISPRGRWLLSGAMAASVSVAGCANGEGTVDMSKAAKSPVNPGLEAPQKGPNRAGAAHRNAPGK